MVDRKIQPLFTLIGIFMLSTSLFLYEILITRLFSTMLFQHLVFFTISLAILGIVIGWFIVYKTKIEISYEKL